MKALDFVFAARPLLLLPVWSVYLVSLHLHHELSGATFDFVNALSLFCLTLLGAGACYVNQVFDVDSDRLNNKVLFVARRVVTERRLLIGFGLTGIVALGLSILISGLFFFICAQLLALSYYYSAAPIRLKDRPVAGLLANAYGIGFVVSFSVFPKININNAGVLGWDSPFYFAMAVGAIYLLTTIPDIDGDVSAGKQTVAVVAGKGVTAHLALSWLVVAVVAALKSHFLPLAGIAVAAALVTLISALSGSSKGILFAAKVPILLLTLLAGWYYPGYLIFVVVLIAGTRIYYRYRFGIKYPSLA